MTLADAVVNEALEYDGAIDDEKDTGRTIRHNWEAFQTFFSVVPGWVWTPARIRQAKTPWKFITENGADSGQSCPHERSAFSRASCRHRSRRRTACNAFRG